MHDALALSRVRRVRFIEDRVDGSCVERLGTHGWWVCTIRGRAVFIGIKVKETVIVIDIGMLHRARRTDQAPLDGEGSSTKWQSTGC